MTTVSPPTPAASFAVIAVGMYKFAQYLVAEILAFQPDLLIGLAHSGWLPVLAAQTVWETQQDAPFPPSLRLNFGQEKLESHNDLWGQTDHNDAGLDRAPAPFLAHVLFWAGEQAQWREELAAMVTAVLGPHTIPQRILVVDEGMMDGATYWPLMGLLTAVYPLAEIRFCPGQSLHWGSKATDAWLEQYAPDALAELERARAQLPAYSPERRALHDALRWAAAGTEDSDPYSLHCCPVDENSQTVRRLSAYLPADRWLSIAPWAHDRILGDVGQMALAHSGPLPPDKRQSYRINQRTALPADIALMRHMWQTGSLTRRVVAAWGNMSLAEASRKLRRLSLRGDIAALGWGGGTHYAPDPVYCPEFAETYGGPEANAYWVIPGKLLAGPHPLTNEGFREAAYQGLVWLQAQGVDYLIDLAGPVVMPWHHGGELAAHLEMYAVETGYRFNYAQHPWTQYATPSIGQLLEMRRTLAAALADGHNVYLHSYRGTGRAAIAAAAYLVGQGHASLEAWRFLCQQWAQTTWGPYRRLPDTEVQRRFMLRLEDLR